MIKLLKSESKNEIAFIPLDIFYFTKLSYLQSRHRRPKSKTPT